MGMLVLSRLRDETIMIGDDVEVTLVDIRGDKVRLGITAPSNIPVHRKEVYEAIQRENRAAGRVGAVDVTRAGAERNQEAVPTKGTRRRGGLEATKGMEA